MTIPDSQNFDTGNPSANPLYVERRSLADEELVEKFVTSRDEGAFNEIVTRYDDKIYALALKITCNPSDAEDILQDVFISLIERLQTFEGRSSFATWLYRVAVNTIFMRLRSDKKKFFYNKSSYDTIGGESPATGYEQASSACAPDKATSAKESLDIIEAAVGEMPESYRAVFHLRDVEGFSNGEAAEILGLTVAQVKCRLHRARLFLRLELSPYFDRLI